MKSLEWFKACIDSALTPEEIESAYYMQKKMFPETFDPEQQDVGRQRGSGSRGKGKGKKTPRNQMSILEKEGGEETK